MFSSNKKGIDWKTVGLGLVFQLIIAIGVLKVPFVQALFEFVGKGFVKILDFTQAGSEFLFKGLISDMDTFVTLTYGMISQSEAIIVPAGTFDDIMNYQGRLFFHDPSQGAPNPKFDNYYYSKGVGLVKSIQNYAAGTDKIERRLLRYQVK